MNDNDSGEEKGERKESSPEVQRRRCAKWAESAECTEGAECAKCAECAKSSVCAKCVESAECAESAEYVTNAPCKCSMQMFHANVTYVPMSQMTELSQFSQKLTNDVQTSLLFLVTAVLVNYCFSLTKTRCLSVQIILNKKIKLSSRTNFKQIEPWLIVINHL